MEFVILNKPHHEVFISNSVIFLIRGNGVKFENYMNFSGGGKNVGKDEYLILLCPLLYYKHSKIDYVGNKYPCEE